MIAWARPKTLRSRLAVWYALAGTVLFSLFAGIVYLYVRYSLARPIDHDLRRDLAVVRSDLTVDSAGRVFWAGRELRTGDPWPASRPWFELWDNEGRLIRRCWPFTDAQLERLPAAPVAGRETISVFDVSKEIRLKVLSVPFAGGTPAMIRVMRIHEPAVNALTSLLLIIAVALPALVALLVVGGYAITRRWLRPLDRMVADADAIGPGSPGRRLSSEDSDDELGRLTRVFNQTLARLENSYETLDRFVADASHELLTPLTTLRSVGEVGLRSARSDEEYREIIGSMLEEAQRLQQLVEKLLQLARASGGTQALAKEQVRLECVVQECVAEIGILAEEKKQRIETALTDCRVSLDPVLFRQALQNLLENAIKFSPEGSTIRLSVERRTKEVAVTVTDEGGGIAPELRERIMDRFFRADRARVAGGFGLGLAITNAYMQAMGGRVEYRPGETRGSSFSLILPWNP